jgi:hypothetical protein
LVGARVSTGPGRRLQDQRRLRGDQHVRCRDSTGQAVISVRSAWRSWFWKVVVFLLMSLMTLIAGGVSVQTAGLRQWWVAVGFGLAAAWLAVGTARALFVGVYARPAGIVVRGPFRTTTIPWDEVVEITGGAATSGASGSLGATSAAVIRRRPGQAQPRRVVLNVLGGYGLIRFRPTPAERAIADLNEHLAIRQDQVATV